jgi:AraC-like DNA-binding protein
VPYTTLSSWARLIWDALPTYDLDPAAVFEAAGLDSSKLSDPSARYPFREMSRLWRVAGERSEDACFGLTVADQWHPTTWHGLGFAWLASGTLHEGLRRLVRYSAVLSTAAEIRVVSAEDVLAVHINPQPGLEDELTPFVLDAAAANLVHMCRVSAGDHFVPMSVALPHPGAGCRRRRQEYFRAPIEYAAERTTVEIDRSVAERPLPSANAELAHANESVVRQYLAQLSAAPTVMRVKVQLIDSLSSGAPSAKTVAAQLNMSERTLQRRLQDEGTTFQALLAETRHEFAVRLMRDDELTLTDVTYLLGFAEVSSFSRSFRRWTGMSPREWRRSAFDGGARPGG